MFLVPMFMTAVVAFRMLVAVRVPMVVVVMVVMMLVLLIMMTRLLFFLLQLILPLGVVENFAHAWHTAPWLKRIRSGKPARKGEMRV